MIVIEVTRDERQSSNLIADWLQDMISSMGQASLSMKMSPGNPGFTLGRASTSSS